MHHLVVSFTGDILQNSVKYHNMDIDMAMAHLPDSYSPSCTWILHVCVYSSIQFYHIHKVTPALLLLFKLMFA